MRLDTLLSGIDVLELHADPALEISDVCYDSRACAPGALFVAISGFAADGHRFIPAALENGACAAIVERPPETPCAYVLVASTRLALAQLGANWFGHPADAMKIIGITGTNGKTTSTYLLKSVLERAAGARVGLIGTIQNMVGDKVLHTERTTPESFELHRLFAEMRDAGCTHVVMEVSSHALVLERVGAIRFAVGAFTNLTEDHLDFHKTMEAYAEAKAILMERCDRAVVNTDDPWAELMKKHAACPVLTYGIDSGAELTARNIALHADGIEFDAVYGGQTCPVRLGIPGQFTAYNCLTVIGCALSLGLSLTEIAGALAEAKGVKGRVEVIPTPGTDYTVLADYAHTPDALENVLRTVRGFCKGRVIALFGCGGDRDPIKRPIMGKIGVDYADLAVITSDNPRTEDPNAIIADILRGVEGTKTPYVTIENRPEAIYWAMAHAQKDDVIVLAGKGHEDYQEINHVKHHLDEREVVADCLARLTREE
ncbi:MAG: UDP-N-acetylmuramoyl-L-alanyl-D-glutamate--2,6-diaminopimelate ligase [Ruminococcaceae bacterium]|jgi:UDP-N-acetylmuramoyl-L-alanyl-D-glutamate--2,6-diaminopimelate ligase|nr:UDP-N-acetylmuramoyl-L-alanyl-D-glutamate--2,6-diaminopimelate ligase [Oscillospiraceae bacterium]